jgi:hypothetical protein
VTDTVVLLVRRTLCLPHMASQVGVLLLLPQNAKRQEEIQQALETVGEDMDRMAEVGAATRSCYSRVDFCLLARVLRIPH